jgi:hypothetical protein
VVFGAISTANSSKSSCFNIPLDNDTAITLFGQDLGGLPLCVWSAPNSTRASEAETLRDMLFLTYPRQTRSLFWSAPITQHIARQLPRSPFQEISLRQIQPECFPTISRQYGCDILPRFHCFPKNSSL